jgi:hypothetical protein
MNDAKYIGMDVHPATISAAVRDSSGNLVMEAILETKSETILQFIRGLRGSLSVTFDTFRNSRIKAGCPHKPESLLAKHFCKPLRLSSQTQLAEPP